MEEVIDGLGNLSFSDVAVWHRTFLLRRRLLSINNGRGAKTHR